MRDGGSWNSREAHKQNKGNEGKKSGGKRNNERKEGESRREKGWREHAGRIAGSDAGWGVLINSQLFIPVSLHRGEQERKRGREGARCREGWGGRKGGYCHCCLNAPLLPAECQHLSLFTSLRTPSLCI